jgi:glycosyltransferase involved in cell wall biosynthesis
MNTRIDWLITGLNVQGGAETFVRRMAPRLVAYGFNLRVITLVGGGSLVEEIREDGVPVFELGLRNKYDYSIINKLSKLWESDPPEIIHTHLFHAGILGRVVARMHHVPVIIVHQHGLEKRRSPIRVFLDRMTSPFVTKYAATCQAVAKEMTRREGISQSKIEIIYNGIFPIDTSIVSPPLEWPVKNSAKVIGCVGRLAPEKGQAILIQALASYETKGEKPHVLLIGDGSYRQELQNKVTSLHLNPYVHFCGIQKNIFEWLPFFDLFVLPSSWEGISLALLEAMACGLAVVATNVGGTPEVVKNGESGLLIPPNDPNALESAIRTLVENPGLCQKMGEAGRDRVRTEFTIEKTRDHFINFYNHLKDREQMN